MKKLIFLLLVFISQLSLAQPDIVVDTLGSDHMNTQERIISFHSDVKIEKDGEVLVKEFIKVYASGNQIKRGIYRSLPLTRNLNDKTQKVKYKDISVKKNGADEDFHTENINGSLAIYVGKKEVFLTPDIYDYEISYRTKNQIGFFQNYDEFYWNVNGLDWDFPIGEVTANIALPSGAKILQNSCYTGKYGDKEQNCTASSVSDNEMYFAAKDFSANEGLTVAVGFNKGVILPPPPPTFLEKNGLLYGLSFLLLGFAFYLFRLWNEHGRDPDKPVVIPQFNPPNKISPASLGYLKREKFQTKFVTASVVDLAVKGYLQISEVEESRFLGLSKSKNYTLIKLKEADGTLPEEEKIILQKLFKGGKKTFEVDSGYDSNVESMVSKAQVSLSFEHSKFLKEGGNQKLLVLPSLIILGVYVVAVFISSVLQEELANIFIGGFFLIFMTILFFVGQGIGRSKVGRKIFWVLPLVMFVIAVISLRSNLANDKDHNFAVCLLFIIFVTAALIVFSYLIRQPTKEKLLMDSEIEGFEMYLSAAENHLMKFHNPPQMTPQIFEKYLPYAIVLGVDEIWGKKFENVMKTLATPYQNNWYAGGTFQNMMFLSAFSNAMTNAVSSAATAPSTSSSGSGSSFGSGSGGGGFSGGGGGGGGGGGW